MPSKNDKPWNRGKKVKPQARPLRRILILCEDEKSSVLYFKKFPVDREVVIIDCEGTGKNTDSLMEDAINRKREASNDGHPYQQIWVVFDRDSFPLRNFNRAFDLAKKHRDIIACWSNECFELWYLLHFQFQNTAMDRERIFKEVGRKVGRNYEKNDGGIYEILEIKIPTAIANARRLDQMNKINDTHHGNPSTKVHDLVCMLQGFNPSNFNPEDDKF